MNFSRKGGLPNIRPSTRPGIEPGTSGLGGTDLYHSANPSADIRMACFKLSSACSDNLRIHCIYTIDITECVLSPDVFRLGSVSDISCAGAVSTGTPWHW